MAIRQKRARARATKGDVIVGPISVLWDTPFVRDVWKRVLTIAPSKNIELHHHGKDEEQHRFVNLGTVLPSGNDNTVANAYCAHIDADVKDPMHWGLNIRPRPNSEPPKNIREEDKKLGGKPGLTRLLQDSLQTDAVPVGQYTVSFSVSERSGWTCSWVPRDTADPEVAGFGNAAKVEEVGYRFTDGVMGITEISVIYKHQLKRWDTRVIARGPIEIEDDLQFPFTNELIQFLCSRVFSRSRDRR